MIKELGLVALQKGVLLTRYFCHTFVTTLSGLYLQITNVMVMIVWFSKAAFIFICLQIDFFLQLTLIRWDFYFLLFFCEQMKPYSYCVLLLSEQSENVLCSGKWDLCGCDTLTWFSVNTSCFKFCCCTNDNNRHFRTHAVCHSVKSLCVLLFKTSYMCTHM